MRIGFGPARGLQILAFLMAGATLSSAIPCGTIAAPSACSITVNGQVTYDMTSFSLVNAVASGGGRLPYQAGDINIDLVSGGGLTALLSFSKNLVGPSGGVVFFVNPGEVEAFSFAYQVNISPAVAGSVAFTNPVIADLNETHTNNASTSFQTAMNGGPPCLSFIGATHAICSLPPGLGTTLNSGAIISMNGNAGNTGISSFSDLYQASFTAASAVPEPSSLALLGIVLCLVVARRVVLLTTRQRLMKQQ